MKIKMKLSSAYLIFCISALIFTGQSAAQTDFGLSVYLIKDDNAYKSRSQYDELINTTSLRLGRAFNIGGVRLYGFYSGDISTFSENKGMRNVSNQFGLAARHSSGNYILDFGAAGSVRRNKDQYVYYNVDKYNMYATLTFEPDFYTMYKLGVTYSNSQFNEFTDIDNNNYRVFTRYQRSFQNRSSLSAEIGLGVKDYVNQTVVDLFGFDFGRFQFPRMVENPVRATQLDFSVRAGKSITDRTGLSAAVNMSRYLGDPIEVFSDEVYYYTENDLYDDPFSFENSSLSLQLTRQFGIGFQARAAYTFYDKNYSGTPALDSEGELLNEYRMDQRNEYSFILSKKVETEWSFPGSIELFFRYMMRDNRSNDPYFTFNDHVGLLGFSIGK